MQRRQRNQVWMCPADEKYRDDKHGVKITGNQTSTSTANLFTGYNFKSTRTAVAEDK